MQAKGIHHLGVAVEDLDEAVDTYQRLFGAELERRDMVEAQGVEAAAMRVGESRVELSRRSGTRRRSASSSPSAGRACTTSRTQVADLRRELADLAEQGVQLIDEEPHHGLFGLEVAFIHPDSAHGVLAELVASG